MEVLGQLAQRPEQRREDPRPGADERVRVVRDVERHRAVVGVHDDLDAVAQVVEGAPAKARAARQVAREERGGVREVGAGRVGVLDVLQAPVVGHDEVRILVVAQERCDPAEPVIERPVEQQLAVGLELVGDEQVQIAEPKGEQEARQPVELDAGRARPAGRDVLAGAAAVLRVIELGLAGADDDVVVVELAEVDARLGDGRYVRGRDGRQVADPQARLALRSRDLVHRDHRKADAVRVRHALVDPAGAGERVQVQLAAGEHHLALHVVHDVAVGVDVVERVVLTHGLELAEGGLQRPVVPQSRVAERVLLFGDRFRGQRRVAAEQTPVLPLVDPERQAGHVHVVGDIGALLDELVGRDHESLDDLGKQPADQDECDDPCAHADPERPPSPATEREDQDRDREDGADDRQQVVGEEPGVGVGVGHARDRPVRSVRQLQLVELEADRDGRDEQGGEDAQVEPDGDREHPATPRRGDGVATAGEHERREQQPVGDGLQGPPERQLEQEERDVATEDRIGDGGRSGRTAPGAATAGPAPSPRRARSRCPA